MLPTGKQSKIQSVTMHVDGTFFPYLDEGSTPSGSTNKPALGGFFYGAGGAALQVGPSLKGSTGAFFNARSSPAHSNHALGVLMEPLGLPFRLAP